MPGELPAPPVGENGQALEGLYEGHTDEITVQLAHHFLKAGQREKTAAYLDRAGDQARRLAALEEPARYYRAALEDWPVADQAGRAELLRKLGECLWMYGDPQQALETLEVAYDLFTALGDLPAALEAA